jgi:hypothetical protein
VLPGRPFVDKYELVGEPEAEGDPEVFGNVSSLGVLNGSGTAAAPGDGVAVLAAVVEGDGEHGSFQTVVNSFNLSQIREPGDQIDIVESVMQHFGVEEDQYTVESDDPIVYHWQPRQTVAHVDLPVKTIVLGGTEGQPVTLLYRHHAIGEFVSVDMTPSGTDGGYLALIPDEDVTPDGLDYYVKAGSASTYEPTTAKVGDVTNAIAVYMPDAAAATPEPTPDPTPAPTPTPSPTPGVARVEDASAAGGQSLPATGGEVLTALGAGLLLTGLGVRRTVRRGA